MTRRSNRRAPGEGSISPIKDEDGKIIAYEGSIELPPGIGGKRRRKKVRGKTRSEVVAKLKQLGKDIDAGLAVGTPRQTVAQFLTHWLLDVVRVKNGPKTYSSYEENVRCYLIPHVGHIRLDQLTQKHVEAMRDVLQKQPQQQRPDKLLGPRTVEYAVKVLQRALNRAIKEGHIARNPAALVELPRSTGKVQPFTLEQAQAFLDAIKDNRLEALFAMLILTGLRIGEALALTWADIDLKQHTIKVDKTLQRISKIGQYTGKTKTAKSTRLASMPDVLVRLLQAHRERQDRERQNPHWLERNLVFSTKRGAPLENSNVRKYYFKPLLVAAGLPETTRIHDLRHTCATLLLDAGENVTNVAAQLGHSKTSVTLDIYGHAVAASQARAVDKLGERLGGKGKE